MDDKEASRAIYEAFAGPTGDDAYLIADGKPLPEHGRYPIQRGREIDVRPDPGGVRTGDETQVLRRPRDWPEGHTTGAFVSAAASIRHSVEPYRWWDRISPAMLFVWTVFLGAPVVAGVWAGIVLWSRLRHG
jgi:hypothetical protein